MLTERSSRGSSVIERQWWHSASRKTEHKRFRCVTETRCARRKSSLWRFLKVSVTLVRLPIHDSSCVWGNGIVWKRYIFTVSRAKYLHFRSRCILLFSAGTTGLKSTRIGNWLTQCVSKIRRHEPVSYRWYFPCVARAPPLSYSENYSRMRITWVNNQRYMNYYSNDRGQVTRF